VKVGILISARNKSKRLKNKLFMNVGNIPIIEFLIKRVKNFQTLAEIILSTSYDKRDKKLIEIAKKNNIGYFLGHKDDKLKRYYHNAKKFNLDAMVVIDGDDPLIFSDLIIKQISLFKKYKYDCIYYKCKHVGISCLLIKTSALKKVIKKKQKRNTEVWGHYFVNSNYLKIKKIDLKINFFKSPLRLTLDYKEDFVLIRKIIRLLNHRTNFKDSELLKILKRNIGILKINSSVVDEYNKHLKLSIKK